MPIEHIPDTLKDTFKMFSAALLTIAQCERTQILIKYKMDKQTRIFVNGNL